MLKKSLFALSVAVSLFANSGAMNTITPDEAIKMLQDGNARFLNGQPTHPHSGLERVQETSKGQHPYVSINSCSDSRVPPELLFDQGFGDVFIVRNAGNVSATDEIGTIEYGTEHLGTRLVVVMGHTKCGAVTAVAKGDHVEGNIPQLVAPIVPAVAKVKAEHKNEDVSKWINQAITANMWEQVANILRKSEIVRDMVLNGKVKIVGAIYDVDTGKVEFLGEHPQQLKILVDVMVKEKEKSKAKTEAKPAAAKDEHKTEAKADVKKSENKNESSRFVIHN